MRPAQGEGAPGGAGARDDDLAESERLLRTRDALKRLSEELETVSDELRLAIDRLSGPTGSDED